MAMLVRSWELSIDIGLKERTSSSAQHLPKSVAAKVQPTSTWKLGQKSFAKSSIRQRKSMLLPERTGRSTSKETSVHSAKMMSMKSWWESLKMSLAKIQVSLSSSTTKCHSRKATTDAKRRRDVQLWQSGCWATLCSKHRMGTQKIRKGKWLTCCGLADFREEWCLAHWHSRSCQRWSVLSWCEDGQGRYKEEEVDWLEWKSNTPKQQLLYSDERNARTSWKWEMERLAW